MGWIKSEEGRKRRDKFDQEYREMMGDSYRNTESGETWMRPKKMFFGKRGNVKRFTKIVEAEGE